MSSFRNPHNLPVKTCVVCERPFTWRKKWESNWDEITTCSKRCNAERKALKRDTTGDAGEGSSSGSGDEAASSKQRKGGKGGGKRGGRSGRARMSEAVVEEEVAVPTVEAMIPTDEAVELTAVEAEALLRQLSVVSEPEEGEEAEEGEEELDPRAARKAAKKAAKALRRARRQGEDTGGQKPCDVCTREVDLLIRCQTDSGKQWRMVCGRCWKTPAVAGGVVDGDGTNPHYRYGGLWKNLHRAAAA